MSRGLLLAIASILFLLLCWFCVTTHSVSQVAAVPAAVPAAVATSPSLNLAVNNGQVTLNGTVPDDATKASIIARANELYGAGKFTDNLKVASTVSKAAWLGAAPALLPALKDVTTGALSVENGELIATGQVANDDTRLKIIRELEKSAAPNLKVVDRLTVGNLTAAASQLQVDLNKQLEGKTIEFETNSDVIRPVSTAILDQVSDVLKATPKTPIEIGGHADNRGNANANLALSERRAKAVLKYLAGKGIDAKSLTAKGYGDTKPIADNATAEGQLKNRRIEFRVRAN